MSYESMSALLHCNQPDEAKPFNLHLVPLNKEYLLANIEEDGEVIQSKVLGVTRATHLIDWFSRMYGWDRVVV